MGIPSPRTYVLVALACCAIPSAACTAEPTIRNLDVRGLRVGGTTTLVIDGDDLGTTPKLQLPFAAKQTLKPGGNDKKATFDITLAADVTPGYHQMRIVTDGGVSLPIVVGIDRLPQVPIAAMASELPIAFHGTVAGGATVETKFVGKAKQKVIVEVEAGRLGSKLRPILHLYSPKKLQLTWSWAMPALHGDTRIEATLPEDGTYTVTLHDVEYAAPAPSFFRLRIGEWHYADQVFPPALSNKGNYHTVDLFGWPAESQGVVNAAHRRGFARIGPLKGELWSGPHPFLTISPFPELRQQATKDAPQVLPEGMVGVSGKLLTAYEEHRFRVPVKPLTKVRLEVFAERIGSPLDTALVVRNEKGDQLVRAEDSPGTLDPLLEYAVPDKVTAIIVGVVDAQGRGGPRGIYRLVIEPQGAVSDFRLTTPVQRVSLPIAGRAVVPVSIERRGFTGKIDLHIDLPPAVKAANTTIPENADGTLVTLERGDAPFDPVVTTWSDDKKEGETLVAVKGHPLERIQPWLANEIAIAPSNGKSADFVVDWNNLPTDAALVPGRKLALPIKTTRTNPKTSVKLTLLTSQVTPIVNNQPDPNKSIRQEKPIEIPANMPNGEVVALLPVELSAPVYDVTVQAELLDAAKKPLAIAYTPVRRLAVKLPLVVKLDGPTKLEATLNAKTGAMIKLQGKVERLADVKSDVQITVTGLPAGAKADPVTVKADASDFVVNVTFPPTTTPGEIKGVKLSGSIAPEPKTPAVRVKSRELEVEFVLKAPAK